jgi:hypothetical protein
MKGLYIHASRLLSQPIPFKKKDSHSSCMTGREPKKQKGITNCRQKRGKLIILFLPTTFYPPPYSLIGPTRWNIVVYNAHLGHIGR